MVFNLSEGFERLWKRERCIKKCFLQGKNALFEAESEICVDICEKKWHYNRADVQADKNRKE